MTLARRLAFDLATRLNPRADLLTSLANLYGTDKGTGRRGHHYTRIYSELLEPIRERPIRMLEIGLLGMRRGGWDDKQLRDRGETQGRDAPSLRMWSQYFPRGEIFGLDFNDFTEVKIERCKIFPRRCIERRRNCEPCGRRSAANSMSSSDDASHASDHQQITLGALFPAVKPGGLFIIEDLFFQPADREPAGATKTVDVLRRAEVTGEFRGSHLAADAIPYLEQHVGTRCLVRFARAQGAHPAPRQPWGALEEGIAHPDADAGCAVHSSRLNADPAHERRWICQSAYQPGGSFSSMARRRSLWARRRPHSPFRLPAVRWSSWSSETGAATVPSISGKSLLPWPSSGNARFVASTGDNFYQHGISSIRDPKWETSFQRII
jgi:hypothetical protein